MPQMAPSNWLIIFLFLGFILLSLVVVLHFFFESEVELSYRQKHGENSWSSSFFR